MDQGPDQGYFYMLSKSLCIDDNSEDEETARQEFEQTGLNLNYVGGSRYLGAYLGLRKGLEAWVRPKLEAWAHRVLILDKISK